MKSELIFQNSPGYLFLCLVFGVVYASLLYFQRTNFSKQVNRILFIIRAVVVGFIILLLINPLFRTNKSIIEKPVVVLLVDNSASMNLVSSESQNTRLLKDKIQQIVSDFKEKGYDIQIHSFNQNGPIRDVNSMKFNVSNTNISQELQNLESVYEGRNLTDVVLVSDGIVNTGLSPVLSKYNFKIHSVAYGDTTERKDVKVQTLIANKIAYYGNKFPIRLEGNATGYFNKEIIVILKNGTEVLEKKVVVPSSDDFLFTIDYLVNPKEKGMQHYSIDILPQTGEFSLKNNTKDIYIDVVNGKEKILLLALTAHPDVKAIKEIISKNELYDLSVRNIQSDDMNQIVAETFDVLILHQLPDIYGMGNLLVNKLLAKNKPTLFILGNQTNVPGFNRLQQVISISNTQIGKADKVSAKLNTEFKQFTLEDEKSSSLGQLPPVLSVFGDYSLGTGAEIILNQKLGNLVLAKPLLAVNSTINRKTAVFSGEGIWRWYLEEKAFSQNNIIEELLSKTLQLISVKEDKRKLKVYPVTNEFDIDEKVIFENEVYNNIYEKLDNQEVHLNISNEKGKALEFDYKVTSENSRFEVSNLSPGLYKYVATANVLGKIEKSEGQFVIKDASLEYMSFKADFDLLKTISHKTGGIYLKFEDFNQISKLINIRERPDIASNIEEMSNLIDLKWMFFLLFVFISIEWVLRKYNGFY